LVLKPQVLLVRRLPPVVVWQSLQALVVVDLASLVAVRCSLGTVGIAVLAGRIQHHYIEDILAVPRIVVVAVVAAGSHLVEKPHTAGYTLHIAGIAVVRIEGIAEIGVGRTERRVESVRRLAGRLGLFEGFRGLNFAVPAERAVRPEHLCRLWENCQSGLGEMNVLSSVNYLPTS
jgi:hypothetical protein